MRRLPVLPSLIPSLIVWVSNGSVSAAAFVLSHRRHDAALPLLPWRPSRSSPGCLVARSVPASSSSASEPHGRTRNDNERSTNPSFWSRQFPGRIRRRTGTVPCILSSLRAGDPAPTTTSTSSSSGEASVLAAMKESGADVSSQPTLTMAARVTPMTSTTKKSEGTSDAPLLGTPLARFNNRVNYERYIDDDQGAAAASALLETNSNGRNNLLVDSEPERPSAGTTSASSAVSSAVPLIVNFLDLMHMAFQSATSPEMQRKRRDFVQQLKHRGGYCVVEMDIDDAEARILHEMWDLMDRVLVPTKAEGEGESSTTMLRRQVLKRSTNSSSSNTTASDNPGYDFVQTTLVDGSVRPLWIHDRHGPQLSQQAAKAYMLLAQLCKAFATVVYSGSSGTLPANATRLMESLLDDPDRSFGGSYHRLCRYLPLPPQPKNSEIPSASGAPPNGTGWGESLRPHADWTISTAIPVSSVAGLEVYEPFALQPPVGQQNEASRRWMRIEQVMQDDWKRKNVARSATSDGTTTTQCCWNAHHVVVFAGAWLELLTDGDVESTLHRVVSRRDDAAEASTSRQQRLSAPFFMRPKELVFERTDQIFDDPSNDDVAQLDSTEAVRAMGRFLRESEFLQV
jgi:hypothetical protein